MTLPALDIVPAASPAVPPAPRRAHDGPALAADGVTRRFGAVTAVSEVSLQLRPGEIHGLIGPNGCGKTTLLNLLSGYYGLSDGHVRIGSDDVSALDVAGRARRGVSRTFQAPRLLKSLTVLDNAMLGGWPTVSAGFVETALALPRARRETREIRERAMAILEGVGLGAAIGRSADLLEHAEQRFLEIARALMTRPRFLLLDEPAGGLTPAEIDALGEVIRVVADAGIGVLLVEHHTDFVFRICDRVTALNLGRKLADGRPDEIRVHPDVIRVYLGA